MTLRSFRALKRNTLVGFAAITLPVGQFDLELDEITLHQQGDRFWVGLPARPMVNSDGAIVRNETGKISYVPIARWGSKAARDAVIRLVRARHPEAFEPDGAP
jgi:hypothetical protein